MVRDKVKYRGLNGISSQVQGPDVIYPEINLLENLKNRRYPLGKKNKWLLYGKQYDGETSDGTMCFDSSLSNMMRTSKTTKVSQEDHFYMYLPQPPTVTI